MGQEQEQQAKDVAVPAVDDGFPLKNLAYGVLGAYSFCLPTFFIHILTSYTSKSVVRFVLLTIGLV